ncbi:T9SS type A sorting domain-containing protein [Flavihumibacter sp. RY-1]|uniref:T9SS type A sorting domain-containing protein n=1 Tax=Flavihumibacter fluminis TaxID=2909236 RepID=A0ABS9BMP7_9BACT|nr:T9SS type A sorting domain-containing protein [Flavihumibacter fluminis]MCF1716971.1 T9SS type A sorting domain-containing protein [Flavihumibacter fluminis]
MRRLVHFTILLLFVSASATAQFKYWVAPGVSGNWSNASNWSSTSGGPGGAGAPTASQTAVFDNGSNANCLLDQPSITLNNILIPSAYTGTISPSGTTSMTIRFDVIMSTGNIVLPDVSSIGGFLTINGGSVTTGAVSSSVGNNFSVSTGTFNANGSLSLGANMAIINGGSFNAGTSTITLTGSTHTSINNNGSLPGTTTFFNLVLQKTQTANNLVIGTNDQVVVTNDLNLIDGLISGPNGSLQVGRNLTVGTAFDGAQTNFTLNGASDAVVTVNAPFISTFSGSTTINKSNPASQVSFVTDLPSNLINFNSLTTNTLNITQGTINFPDNDAVVWNFNNFNIGANATFNAPSNTMTILGNFNNSGSFNANNGTVEFTSAANRFYSFGTSAQNGTTTFFDVIINNTNSDGSFNIEIGDRLAISNNLTINAGYLNSIGGNLSNQSFVSVGGALSIQSSAKPWAIGVHLEFTGANPQSVTLAASATSHINGNVSFLKTAPGPITLNSPVVLNVVGQVVTFTGGVVETTNTNILNFAVNGVVALGGNAISHVDGPILRSGISAFTFPTGDAGIYAPIHISGTGFNSNIPSATYIAQYIRNSPDPLYPIDQLSPTNPPDLQISDLEYWILDQQGPVTAGPRIWLSYSGNSGVTDPTTIGVTQWDNPGFWQLIGNGGLQNVGGASYVASASTNVSNVSSADPVFTLSTIDPIANPLPVTWLSFTGRYFNGSVDLNWSTSLEVNNEEYTIERSADGQNFTAIGNVPGIGNTTSISRYSFKDTNPLSGSAYYRIKQTDRDGKFSYSDVIRVSNNEVALKGIRLFPNPVSGNMPLTIENGNWSNKKVTITIYNAVGGIVRQEQITFGSDSRAKINVESLQKGSYFITTSINNERQTMQFFIQ